MVGDGFVGGGSTEFVAANARALGELGGPHLLEDVGERGFEDAAGDRLEGCGETEVGLFQAPEFLTTDNPYEHRSSPQRVIARKSNARAWQSLRNCDVAFPDSLLRRSREGGTS